MNCEHERSLLLLRDFNDLESLRLWRFLNINGKEFEAAHSPSEDPFSDFVGEKFKGNETVAANVFRLVDHSHTAAAELLKNTIMRDSLTNEDIWASHSAAILGAEQS
jgi:hypothetical protein